METFSTDNQSEHLTNNQPSWERQRTTNELLGFITCRMEAIPVDISLEE